MFGMQAERALRLRVEGDADAAQTTADQRLQEQAALTMAEKKRASLLESELVDTRNELQAALRAVQVSFGSLPYNQLQFMLFPQYVAPQRH